MPHLLEDFKLVSNFGASISSYLYIYLYCSKHLDLKSAIVGNMEHDGKLDIDHVWLVEILFGTLALDAAQRVDSADVFDKINATLDGKVVASKLSLSLAAATSLIASTSEECRKLVDEKARNEEEYQLILKDIIYEQLLRESVPICIIFTCLLDHLLLNVMDYFQYSYFLIFSYTLLFVFLVLTTINTLRSTMTNMKGIFAILLLQLIILIHLRQMHFITLNVIMIIFSGFQILIMKFVSLLRNNYAFSATIGSTQECSLHMSKYALQKCVLYWCIMLRCYEFYAFGFTMDVTMTLTFVFITLLVIRNKIYDDKYMAIKTASIFIVFFNHDFSFNVLRILVLFYIHCLLNIYHSVETTNLRIAEGMSSLISPSMYSVLFLYCYVCSVCYCSHIYIIIGST